MKDFLQLANDRYSVRKFADKAVEQEKIDNIVEAGVKAPTACNLQPFKIWVVKSAEAKNVINKSNPFPFVHQAPVLIVVGSNPKEGWVRQFDNKSFADVDASIVATHIMLAIHDLGLGTTWIGHFDEKIIKAEFEEMRDYNLIAIFPVGYIADDCVPAKGHSEFKDYALTVKEL